MSLSQKKESAVNQLNRALARQGLRLCINCDGPAGWNWPQYTECGFYFIIEEGTGKIVRANVNLRELGHYLSAHGTLPPG